MTDARGTTGLGSRVGPGPVRRALAAGAFFGALAGLGEVVWLGARRTILGELVFVPEYFWWMAPALNALLVAVAATILVGATLALPRSVPARLSFALPVGLATTGVLLLPGRLHWAAITLLALGVGIRLGGWLHDRAHLVLRPMVLSLPVLLVVAPAAAIGLIGVPRTSGPDGPASGVGKPNVLLIVLDTVRAIELSLYGADAPTTPGLDTLGSDGVVFESATSTAPWTLPSHASLFTGLWAHELSTDYLRPLDESEPTLAEALLAEGYVTAGFAANHEYTTRESGLARGFVHYEDRALSATEVARLTVLSRALLNPAWKLAGDGDIPGRIRAEEINLRALRWLDRPRENPFFVFLNYYDAHAPYGAPDSTWNRFVDPEVEGPVDISPQSTWARDSVDVRRRAYRAAIAHLDAQLRILFDALESRGLMENTLIVITSDHGEEFLEHGVMGHGHTLYRPGIHVPLMIRWPGRVPRNRRVETTVSIRDIAATIMDLVGARDHALPGESLRPLWNGVPGTPERLSYSQVTQSRNLPAHYLVMQSSIASVSAGSWRLIVEDRADGAVQLFDHEVDPLELRDLAADPTFESIGTALLDSMVGSGILSDPTWRQ